MAAGGRAGFTLLELLVATALFMILAVVLASIANNAASVWSWNESKSNLRQAARAAMSRMGGEMRQAVLPLDGTNQTSLQFVVNPPQVSTAFQNRDAIFWQAPIATGTNGADLAIVGYFVRRDGNTSKLCRLFVNPGDSGYTLHDGTGNWLSDPLLNDKAPGTEASDLQGVFLEDVLGMWVNAYSDASTLYTAYDSRVAHKLPARVDISLALLDKAGAKRIASGAIPLPDSRTHADVDAFLGSLPNSLRKHVSAVTITVPFSP